MGLLLKLLKTTGLVSKVIPSLLRMWAEGKLGAPAQKLYWLLAGYKTITGAVLLAVGTGLETTCAGYADYAWTCQAAPYVYMVGAALAAIGLVDGGTRSPWPSGTPIPEAEKKG